MRRICVAIATVLLLASFGDCAKTSLRQGASQLNARLKDQIQSAESRESNVEASNELHYVLVQEK